MKTLTISLVAALIASPPCFGMSIAGYLENSVQDLEFRIEAGTYRAGHIPSRHADKAFVQFLPDDGTDARHWTHEQPISEFTSYRNKVYLLDIEGNILERRHETWEPVSWKSGHFATFLKLPDDQDLITCFPVPVTKELPPGQDRVGGCWSMERGWSVAITWEQTAHPPVMCGQVIVVTGFLIPGKNDTRGRRNRQKVLQSIRLSDGQISTVRKLPKNFFDQNLCAFLPKQSDAF